MEVLSCSRGQKALGFAVSQGLQTPLRAEALTRAGRVNAPKMPLNVPAAGQSPSGIRGIWPGSRGRLLPALGWCGTCWLSPSTTCRGLVWLRKCPGCKSSGREGWEPLQGARVGTHPARRDTVPCLQHGTGGMRAGKQRWVRAAVPLPAPSPVGPVGARDAARGEGRPGPGRPWAPRPSRRPPRPRGPQAPAVFSSCRNSAPWAGRVLVCAPPGPPFTLPLWRLSAFCL